MEENKQEKYRPAWLTNKLQVKETTFVFEFVADYPIRYIGDRFYTPDGGCVEDDVIRKMVYDELSLYLEFGAAKKAVELTKALKLATQQQDAVLQRDRVHVKNGTLFLDDWEFDEQKYFCMNRLNITYDPDAGKTIRWNDFLFELLEQQDILTLQEYMGYCLIPDTRAQKMMMILGRGGEGKSRIGAVMRAIFGDNMNTTSIQKVCTNRFSRADLENKLVMVDDDMDLSALTQTNYLKTIITAEGKMDLERKGVQSYQRELYVRFLCFGNGALTSLHDRSDGFFRRQLILTAKPKDPNREDDPFLTEKLMEEKEGIFLWMLEGLRRLIAQNYQFTVSERTKANLRAVVRDANNIVSFLSSEGYVTLLDGLTASTRELYECYLGWCGDNAEHPLSQKSFASYLSQEASTYHLQMTNNIHIGGQKRCRGYLGIGVGVFPAA